MLESIQIQKGHRILVDNKVSQTVSSSVPSITTTLRHFAKCSLIRAFLLCVPSFCFVYIPVVCYLFLLSYYLYFIPCTVGVEHPNVVLQQHSVYEQVTSLNGMCAVVTVPQKYMNQPFLLYVTQIVLFLKCMLLLLTFLLLLWDNSTGNLYFLQMRAHPFPPSRTRSSALSSGGCLNSNSGESSTRSPREIANYFLQNNLCAERLY